MIRNVNVVWFAIVAAFVVHGNVGETASPIDVSAVDVWLSLSPLHRDYVLPAKASISKQEWILLGKSLHNVETELTTRIDKCISRTLKPDDSEYSHVQVCLQAIAGICDKCPPILLDDRWRNQNRDILMCQVGTIGVFMDIPGIEVLERYLNDPMISGVVKEQILNLLGCELFVIEIASGIRKNDRPYDTFRVCDKVLRGSSDLRERKLEVLKKQQLLRLGEFIESFPE